MNEIIYSGTHCGGCLEIEAVKSLNLEYKKLQQIAFQDKRDEERLRYFEKQLGELIETSLRVNKPIAI